MEKKTKVVLIQRVFAEYRKAIYDRLLRKIDLRVLHAQGNVGIPETSTSYSIRVNQTKYGQKETNTFLWIFKNLFKLQPDVVIHEFAIGILSLPLTFLITRIIGAKFLLWSHGYDRRKGFNPEKKIADKYRLFLMKKADAIILYGQMDKTYLSQFLQAEKIFVAQNTLNTQKFLEIKENLLLENRELVKQRLDFSHTYNLVFIGRLLCEKKPDLLIEIYEKLLQKSIDVGIHFVGDGEMLANLTTKVNTNGYEKDIIFHGTINNEISTGELMFCSDLMIMPGYLGLSVNHAFCFDCPVISFKQGVDGPFHSPEVEYIINGKTGFLVEEHSVEAITETILEYLNNTKLQQEMKINIRNMVRDVCSIENMENGVLDAILYTMK